MLTHDTHAIEESLETLLESLHQHLATEEGAPELELSADIAKEVERFLDLLQTLLQILKANDPVNFLGPQRNAYDFAIWKLKEATEYVQSVPQGKWKKEKLASFRKDVFNSLETFTLENDGDEQLVFSTLDPYLKDLSASGVKSTEGEGSKMSKRTDSDEDDMYYDPITCELMCDPVKGSDGHTYDRWTIIDHNMNQSPFDQRKDRPFFIACDDLNVRSALFEKFESSNIIDIFHERRRSYRDRAIELAKRENDDDGDEENNNHDDENLEILEMLNHVLEWAPEDTECRELRKRVVEKFTTSDQFKLLMDGTKLMNQPDDYFKLRLYPLLDALREQERGSNSPSTIETTDEVMSRGIFELPFVPERLCGCLFSTCCVCVVMCCLLCVGRNERDEEPRGPATRRGNQGSINYRFQVGNT